MGIEKMAAKKQSALLPVVPVQAVPGTPTRVRRPLSRT